MITKSNVTDVFDFSKYGASHLRLCGVEYHTERPELACAILIEEPPTRRHISIDEVGIAEVWTPWLYHYCEVDEWPDIESASWVLNSDTGYKIFSRPSRFSDTKRDLHEWGFFNLDYDQTVCYKSPSYLHIKDLEPAEKIIRCINAWWMGKNNLDYGLDTSSAFWQHLMKKLLKDPKYPDQKSYDKMARWNSYLRNEYETPKELGKYLRSIKETYNLDILSYDIKKLVNIWSELSVQKVLQLQKKEPVIVKYRGDYIPGLVYAKVS